MATAPASGPTVLVVEDEEALRQLLVAALPRFGFHLHVAARGAEGVELYRRHRDAIDLVLCNVRMPDMDGPETLAALRAINPRVRLCFMTGHVDQYEVEELLGRGAACVIEKPFRLAELADRLRHAVAGG